MTAPLVLAAAHGRFPSPITIDRALALAGIALVMSSRIQGQPLQAKRLLLLPAAFVILGISDLTGKNTHNTAKDIRGGFLIAGVAGNGRLQWPQCGRLKWLHLASVD